MTKLKSYHGHELEYRRMKREGIATWSERDGDAPVDGYTERFLLEILNEPWSPSSPGRAVELGCGTGPLLRWLRARGWSGVGVDVSPTAIAMARKQSAGLRLRFRVGDVLDLDFLGDSSVDLVVDGHCFHCLTDSADHPVFFREAARVLKPGGCFLLLAMCSPVDRKGFAAKNGVIQGKRIFARLGAGVGARFEETIQIKGRPHMPIRYVERWETLLRSVRRAGLTPRLVRLALCRPGEPVSDLSLAAVK